MTRERRPVLPLIAIGIAVISLVLNIYLLSQLRRAERALAPVRPLIEEMVGDDGTVRSEVRIPAGTPISLEVPVDEMVSVRIDTILPIRARITFPLRSPIGDYDIPVPVRADIPIRTTIPLRLRHTFQVRTNTSAEIVVPIELGR